MRIFPASMLKGLSSTYKNAPDRVNGLFFLAVEAGDIKAVNKIISIPGFDVNKPKDVRGHTALMNAAFNNCYKIVQALINKGANVNVKTEGPAGGYTALHAAIEGSVLEDTDGNIGIINLLLKHGANINGGDGFTPLMEAAIQANKEIVELLLSNGADPNLKDNEGHTALDFIKDGRAHGNTQLIRELTDLLSKAMK
ncbi:MAG: ankyrin repeat domain-containing protein [Candidatus Melainabacteria bacterium]|nr:ankyrin repeat domain-containing protein [Candidatus Melainabacteria bacterium]